LLTRLLISFALVAIVLAAYPHTGTAFFSYANLGGIKANIDYQLGLQKYYLYGYIDSDVSSLMVRKLRAKDIEAVFRGCEIGGPAYGYEMTYNRVVRQYLPEGYLRLSDDDFESMRRINEDSI